MKDIQVQPVALKDLHRFAVDLVRDAESSHAAPITLARAKAHMKNPYARKDDIVLLAAFENGRCIGYVGRMPGILAASKGFQRVFWITTFFLEEQYRGKGLGKLLLKKFAGLGCDFVTSRVTPKARNAMLGLGMKAFGELTYYQVRVEKSHLLKPFFDRLLSRASGANEKNNIFLFLRKLEKAAVYLEKRLFYASISRTVEKMADGFEIREANGIEEADFFSGRPSSPPYFYRGHETIQWMLENKWVFPKAEAGNDIDNYYFSGAKDLFHYFPLRLFSGKVPEYKGFLVLCASSQKKRTMLRVLDNSLGTENEIAAGCAAAFSYARVFLADRVELPGKWGDYLLRTGFLKRFLKKQKREYLYYSNEENGVLEFSKGKIRLDYCDGDVAFT